jgi:hypothetical protein
MLTFATIGDARNAIMDFRADHFSALPETLRPRFRELTASPSPVDQIVNVGEFLWANRATVDNDAKALAGGLIAFATINAWHGLLEGDRGNRIVRNLRKEIGEIQTAPAAPDARLGFLVETVATPPEAAIAAFI